MQLSGLQEVAYCNRAEAEAKNRARFSCPPGKFVVPPIAPDGSMTNECIIDVGFKRSIMNVPLSNTFSSYA